MEHLLYVCSIEVRLKDIQSRPIIIVNIYISCPVFAWQEWAIRRGTDIYKSQIYRNLTDSNVPVIRYQFRHGLTASKPLPAIAQVDRLSVMPLPEN